MKNEHFKQLNWHSRGIIEIATDGFRVFKIDLTEGRIVLSVSDQLEEYLIGTCKSMQEAKRKANEKRSGLLMRDRSRETFYAR